MSSKPRPFAVLIGHPNEDPQPLSAVPDSEEEGPRPPLTMEVMTVMAAHTTQALRSAAAISQQRGCPDAIIIGVMTRDEIEKIGEMMSRCEDMWKSSTEKSSDRTETTKGE